MKSFTRRHFLRGLGASTLALPLMPSLLNAAEALQRPKNLIIMFSPNGSLAERWRPTGSENDWEINPNDILGPLIRHKKDLLVIEGVDMKTSVRANSNGVGDDHQRGMGHMLTARNLVDNKSSEGPSVDQYIAEQIGVLPLTLAIKPGGANAHNRMSYFSSGSPATPLLAPKEIFESIFGNLDQNPEAAKQLLEQRRSVLDFVKGDLGRIKKKVSANDLQRLESHLAAVRSLEQKLISSGANGVCMKSDSPEENMVHTTDAGFPETSDFLQDMIVKSLECGLTQVATLQYSRSTGGAVFSFLDGVNRGHHDLSHENNTNTDAMEQLVKINRWYAEQMGKLIDKLKNVTYSDGTTLFDQTAILWVNELGRGSTHVGTDVPYVLAGSCGGYFRLNRFIESDDEPHNNMLLSLCHAMGVPDATFGNTKFSTGILKNLT